MIEERYFANTIGGHNKDYRMVIDWDSNTLDCIWGPIDGSKRHDHFTPETEQDLTNLVSEKVNRRFRNGYSLISCTDMSMEFDADIQELRSAERLAG